MKRLPCRLIVFLTFGLIIQISANFSEYKIVYDDPHFLMEGIFQVIETDLNQDNQSEVVIAGKNYVGQELFIYWLGLDNQFKPVVKWQSPNLFEERSVLWVASGKFQGQSDELLGVTNTKLYLYKYDSDNLQLIEKFSHNLDPLNITSGDIDGDGQDELIAARIGQITSKIYNGFVEAWKLQDGQWVKVADSVLLGNIRSITTGDLDKDGLAEVIVEEGPQTTPGNIHVLHYNKSGKLVEISQIKKPIKGAIYSLKVKNFPDGLKLMTASTRGKINIFSWDGKNLVLDQGEMGFSSGLVDADSADLDLDGKPEIYIVGYPQRFLILNRVEK